MEAGREPGSLCLPLGPAEAGALGSLAVVPVGGPAMGLSLAGPSGVGLGLRALQWFACVDPVTDASGFPYRPSFDGGLGRCIRAVSCGRRHRPFSVRGRHAQIPCVCACACFLGGVRQARLPGAFWCASSFPVAVSGPLFVCSAPTGLGLPCLWIFLRFSFSVRPPCLQHSVFTGPGCLGPWRLVVRPPPLFCLFFFPFCTSPSPAGFFFLSVFFSLFAVRVFCFFSSVLPFFFFSAVCWLCPPPPPAAGCGVLCCDLSCGVSSGAAVCGVFCAVPSVVWRACVALGSCAVLWCVLLCCFCCALLSPVAASSAGFLFSLRCSLPFRGAPGCFCFCALLMRCFARVPAALLSVRCSLAPAALAVVLCCCLWCLRVCCWAWLSSVVSWWVLVGPGVMFRWCAVVCSWVLCCAVSVRVVPLGVVLLCAVLFCFALLGAVARCVESWGAVHCPGVLCLRRCVLSCLAAVCVLLWCVAAWCCSPLCFVPCASWGVVLCVPCPRRPVQCCCAALVSLGSLLPCAVPHGAVLPCGAVVSCPAALFGLFPVFVWFLPLVKPLQNLFKKHFFK